MRTALVAGLLFGAVSSAAPSPAFTAYLSGTPLERSGGGETLFAVRAACTMDGSALRCKFSSIRLSSNASKGCFIAAREWQGRLPSVGPNRWRGTAQSDSCAKWDVVMVYDDKADKWMYEGRDVSSRSDSCPPPLPTPDVAHEYPSPFSFTPTLFTCERIIGLAP